MDFVNVNVTSQNDIIKFINPNNKTLFTGTIKKIDTNCLGIIISKRQDNFIELSKNQFIELILVHKQQAIKCSCVILGSTRNEFGQSVIISLPNPIFAIDRRTFERISVVMNMEYSPLPFELDYKVLSSVDQKYFSHFRKTYTIDISAAGLCCIVPKGELDIKFAVVNLLLKNDKITTLCKKVRTDYMDNSRYNKVAFEYKDIQERHRQLICNFISKQSKSQVVV